ncbi:MAG: lipopolysaccharide biosynthesis protein, partial [Bacteroidales bacterium]|nr:lipopolysaccharide biosynthesis protein [Bacteroidales bacterium]
MEENNRRIVKNSIWMYVRMLFIMVISLYTSRVVPDLLGVSDFGIYSLVAGIVSIFTVISGTLNSSV